MDAHHIRFTSLWKMYNKNIFLIWLVNFQNCVAIKKSHYDFKAYPYPHILITLANRTIYCNAGLHVLEFNPLFVFVILIGVVHMVLENAQKSRHVQRNKVSNKSRSAPMVTSGFPHCTMYLYIHMFQVWQMYGRIDIFHISSFSAFLSRKNCLYCKVKIFKIAVFF